MEIEVKKGKKKESSSLLKMTRSRCSSMHTFTDVSIQPSMNRAFLFACSFISSSDGIKKGSWLTEREPGNKEMHQKAVYSTESLWQGEEPINRNELCWMTVMVMTVSHKPTAVSLLRLFYLISQLHLHRAVTFCGMCLWDGSSSLFVCCTICSNDRTLNNKTAVCLSPLLLLFFSMICGWVSGASFPDVWSKAIN